jgi:dipeptidyl aminopeptidase/acylaminoacyl peptidase
VALKGPGDPAATAASPAMMANRADAPLLLIHGKDDTVVPFSQAQEMLEAMRRAGKPVELTVLPGEDHWLSSGDTRTRMLEAMVGFLEKHNPPEAGATKQARAAPPVASGAVAR